MRGVVTIDGPAGSGKSTVARALARRLGWAYLDTGAMYRAVTLLALRDGVDLNDPEALAVCARQADLQLDYDDQGLQVRLNGRDVSGEIRSPEVTDSSHAIAASPGVRGVLVDLQRRIAGDLGAVVAEGRDQGSVVFPDADVKFFLTGDPVVRARRRLAEMRERGQQAQYQEVYDSIVARDLRDATRDVAPLVKPVGAVAVDTTAMTIEQVVAALAGHVETK